MACTRPSRSTRAAPSASALGPAVSERQKVRACRLSAANADAPSVDSATVLRAPPARHARRGRRSGPVAVVDDHGERRAVRVVVSVLDQRGHVEQVEVEPLRGQQRHRRLGHDVQVAPALVIAASGTSPSGPGSRLTERLPSPG